MKAYKAFEKGLVCRGYQFYADKVNITDKANCVQNGFHCAENPLDCLTYYSNFENAEYWQVEAYGDLDEDDRDSKISCTHIKLVKKLDIKSFVAEALKYIYCHPTRKADCYVAENEGTAENLFVIVRGLNPIASGKKGSILGFAQEDGYGNIIEISMIEIDGDNFKENIFYNSVGDRAFNTSEGLQDE